MSLGFFGVSRLRVPEHDVSLENRIYFALFLTVSYVYVQGKMYVKVVKKQFSRD